MIEWICLQVEKWNIGRKTMERDTQNIMDWLKDHHISLPIFAKIIGVDKSYIYKILKGFEPSPKILKKISSVTMGKVVGLENLRDNRFD